MNLLAHASVGLTGAVSMVARGEAVEVRDMVDRLVYRHDLTADAADCYRRLRDGYAYAGEVVTEQGEGEPLPAYAARHARALHAAMRRDTRESDRLATATITALARSGAKCAEGYSADGTYRATINGFTRTGTDPARVVLDAAHAAGLSLHAAVIALRRQRLGPSLSHAMVVPCGAGLDAHVEPVPGCTQGRVVATLRERASGRMAHPLAFAEGATRDEAIGRAVEALRAALTNTDTTQETVR